MYDSFCHFRGAPRRWLYCAVGLMCVAWVGVCGAAVSQVTWFRTTAVPSPGLDSPDQTVNAVAAYCVATNMGLCTGAVCSGPQSPSCTLNSHSWVYTTWPTVSVTWNYTTGSGPHTTTDSTVTAVSTANNAVCPVSGTNEDVFTQWAANGSVCGADGCLYSASNPSFRVNSPPGTHYLTTMVSAGQVCASTQALVPSDTASPAGAGAPSVAAAPACQASSSGVVGCDAQSTAGPGCGSFNGDYVCVPALPSGGCVSFASGGTACVSTASAQPSGPAPNDGTPSSPASANGQVTYNTTTVNYFNAVTVAGSSIAPTTTSASNGGYAAGTGSTGGTGTGTGSCVDDSSCSSVSGGEACDVPPSCTGEDVYCSQLLQQFNTRCATEPTAAAIFGDTVPTVADINHNPGGGDGLDVSSALSSTGFLSGTCPADIPMDLGDWGTITIPLSTYCWVFELIGVAVMACAWIGAAKIVVGVNAT